MILVIVESTEIETYFDTIPFEEFNGFNIFEKLNTDQELVRNNMFKILQRSFQCTEIIEYHCIISFGFTNHY